MRDDGRVDVIIEGSHGYVWNGDDALWLRRKHRIVGAMIGSCPEYKEQNDFLGPPLELSKNDITVLLMLEPCPIVLSRLCPVRAPPARTPQLFHDSDDDGSLPDTWQPVQAEWPPWREQLLRGEAFDVAEERSDQSREAVAWTYPETLAEKQHCAVYRDLHSQGFYLTDGIKFGGHYLAYPGDPYMFHATFAVRVVPSGSIDGPELTAACRAATGAKKKLLLATPEETSDGPWQVRYLTATSIMLTAS